MTREPPMKDTSGRPDVDDEDDGDFWHVLPVNDLRDHDKSASCWCKPVALEDEPRVIVHNAMDGREAFETGERKPS